MSRPTDPAWRRAAGRERSAEAQGLSAVLDEMLSEPSIQGGVVTGVLGREWASVVGDRLAGETAHLRLDERGVLLVGVSSSAWAAQVTFLANGIVEAANRVAGAGRVRSIRVAVRGRRGP